MEFKANPSYKTQDMVKNLEEPDFNLDDQLTLNVKDKFNTTNEEKFNYNADIDIIK